MTKTNSDQDQDKTSEAEIAELKADAEKMRDALKTANAEAAKSRHELKAVKKAEEDKANEGKTEIERLTAVVTEMQKERATEKQERAVESEKMNRLQIESAVLVKATEMGFSTPGDAILLIDLSEVEITDGKVTGFEKELEALATSGRLPLKNSVSIGTPIKPGKGKAPPQQAKPIIRI